VPDDHAATQTGEDIAVPVIFDDRTYIRRHATIVAAAL